MRGFNLWFVQAFKALGDTYWLFSNDLFDSKDAPNLGGLYLACPAEVQERCAALVEMEVERWAERVEEEGRPVDESGDEEDDDGGEKRKKAKQGTYNSVFTFGG